MAAPTEKDLWVAWTHDAITRYAPPEDADDATDLVDDMSEVASRYADAMLEEYNNRFSGRRRKKTTKNIDDDDDDEDEDD